jgi:hypothetical protein
MTIKTDSTNIPNDINPYSLHIHESFLGSRNLYNFDYLSIQITQDLVRKQGNLELNAIREGT